MPVQYCAFGRAEGSSLAGLVACRRCIRAVIICFFRLRCALLVASALRRSCRALFSAQALRDASVSRAQMQLSQLQALAFRHPSAPFRPVLFTLAPCAPASASLTQLEPLSILAPLVCVGLLRLSGVEAPSLALRRSQTCREGIASGLLHTFVQVVSLSNATFSIVTTIISATNTSNYDNCCRYSVPSLCTAHLCPTLR